MILKTHLTFKHLYATAGGAVLSLLAPIWALIVVCGLAIVFDCISAVGLSRRLKKKGKAATGKLKSKAGKKMLPDFGMIIGIIFMAHLVDEVIIKGAYEFSLHLANWAAGIFVVWQIISVLENYSSENDARWAKFMQKFLINKAERHLEIDINEENGDILKKDIQG